MGKPAARLGDSTAHGGVITGPGCPTVLIGGMPAACVGDLHVCPMVTPGAPPVPHAGGPISPGSTGVFIGGKPAARMGDMAVCAGPPSSIIMGCMTVLIGEAGGSGGGSGGTGTAGAIQSAAMAGDCPPRNQVGDHYLDLKFVDAGNLPLGGLGYSLAFPDNSVREGIFGDRCRMTGVPQGDYTVTLRGIVGARWSAREAKAGTEVMLDVDTVGAGNGEKARIDIYMRDGDCADHCLAGFETEVDNDHVRRQWTVQVDEKYHEKFGTGRKKYSRRFLFFTVKIGELSEQSGLLHLLDRVENEVVG
jgi:uncharacterized Zn-binding protein involved in type VI secretion